jgi:integrase
VPEYTVQRLLGRYAVVWRDLDGKRRRFRLEATDKSTAEAEARTWWKRQTGVAATVGGIVESYIEARELAGIASTARQRDAWKAMKDFWGKVDPALIDAEMCREYVRRRDRGQATTRYELSMLAVALRWARKAELIDKAAEIWRPEAPERRERHLTPREFARWVKEVKAPHAKLYVDLAVATMARPTAILELTWPQVDWDRGTLNLNPPGRRQTRKRRPIVPLDDDTLASLKLAHEAAQSDYIIERGGKRVGNIKKAFQAASARSGVKVTPYTLRHTGAVWAAEAGTPMAELAQFMGHDDDSTTQKHYARFSPDHLRGVSVNLQRAKKQALGFNT